MILAIDVGNSNVVVGVFEGDTLRTSWRFATDHERMPDEWWSLLVSLSSAEPVELADTRGAIISSVVPRLTPKIGEMIEQRLGILPHIVSTSIDLGVELRTDVPEEAGADRIANVAGVRALHGTPAIVVDFGTATTFDVVSHDGAYLGGAIAPGVQLALDALTGRAARLSAIELTIPDHAIGSNTVHSVQSGTVLGYLELVNGMLRRISDELDGTPTVVATGGLGQLFHEKSSSIHAFEPDLTLHGLARIYQFIAGETAGTPDSRATS